MARHVCRNMPLSCIHVTALIKTTVVVTLPVGPRKSLIIAQLCGASNAPFFSGCSFPFFNLVSTEQRFPIRYPLRFLYCHIFGPSYQPWTRSLPSTFFLLVNIAHRYRQNSNPNPVSNPHQKAEGHKFCFRAVVTQISSTGFFQFEKVL